MLSTLSVKPKSTGDFVLQVKAEPNGLFGVFANADLILEHPSRAEADAHCKRLRKQQAAEAQPK